MYRQVDNLKALAPDYLLVLSKDSNRPRQAGNVRLPDLDVIYTDFNTCRQTHGSLTNVQQVNIATLADELVKSIYDTTLLYVADPNMSPALSASHKLLLVSYSDVLFVHQAARYSYHPNSFLGFGLRGQTKSIHLSQLMVP
jgi:hypothetical protein